MMAFITQLRLPAVITGWDASVGYLNVQGNAEPSPWSSPEGRRRLYCFLLECENANRKQCEDELWDAPGTSQSVLYCFKAR